MAHILIIGAVPQSLTNFRGDLIRKLIDSGHQVTAMASKTTTKLTKNIEKTGAKFIPYTIKRNRVNPVTDIISFITIFRTFSAIRPDIVLAYTIKPVISAGITSLFFKNIKYFALITGLGYVFQSNKFPRSLIKKITYIFYFIALKPAHCIIFQNYSNQKYMIKRNIVKSNKSTVVFGSGVNLKYYSLSALNNDSPKFLLIARLLKEKGIIEYIEAAKAIKEIHPNAEFLLVGGSDPSPDSISIKRIIYWHNKNIINYCGEVEDVRPYLKKCHIYVLPSYHEGMPRTILEAMSMGRPILTTNVPGCKETVKNNKNGFIVNPRDTKSLTEKMLWFIENKDRWNEMGKMSHNMAKTLFDVQKINTQLFDIMGLA